MKKNTFFNLVALGALISTGSVMGQNDTVRVKTTTTETYSTSTTPQTTAPATVATPAPAPAVAPAATADDNHDEDAPLRRTELGFRYYPTFSSLRVRNYNGDAVTGSLTMSHGFGAFVGHNFNHHVGVILELDYNQVSQKYKDRSLDRQVSVSYLNIPVLLSLNTDKANWVNWNFVVGPQFGLNVGSSVKTNGTANGDTLRATVGVKGSDVGLAYGTGLEFALNKEHTVRLDVGFRGFYGLVDMNANQSSSNPDTYNVVLRAARKYYAGYVGLAFMF